jgi:uncharacterized membrane protein
MAAVAYYLLTLALLARHGSDSALSRALGRDVKGKVSVLLYLVAISSAFITPWIAGGLYVAVAVMWLVPDRRMERALGEAGTGEAGGPSLT